jgi:hypothetical protein
MARVSAGMTRSPCHGCGTDVAHEKGKVCLDCAAAIKAGRDRIALARLFAPSRDLLAKGSYLSVSDALLATESEARASSPRWAQGRAGRRRRPAEAPRRAVEPFVGASRTVGERTQGVPGPHAMAVGSARCEGDSDVPSLLLSTPTRLFQGSLTYLDFSHPEVFESKDAARSAANDFARAVLIKMLNLASRVPDHVWDVGKRTIGGIECNR